MFLPNDQESQKYLRDLERKQEREAELAELLNEYLSIQEQNIHEIPSFPSKSEFEDFFLACFVDLKKGLKKDCEKHLFPYIRQIEDASFVELDPYFQVLKGLSVHEKGLSLTMKNVLPGELFPYSSYEVGPLPYFEERPSFAYSEKGFSYPVFSKSERPWMSLVPHEIKTMEKAIRECEGEVLTYGLGMGYFAYRAATKENVSHVTVVESDRDVISFFKKHLLPAFPKDKIILLEQDALSFAKRAPKGAYDFLFVDIYHDVEDGLPLYIALKQAEGAAKKSSYWIEEDLLIYFRRYLVSYILEQNDPEIARLGDLPYQEESDFASKLFKNLHSELKTKRIKGIDDVFRILENFSLLEIIKRVVL